MRRNNPLSDPLLRSVWKLERLRFLFRRLRHLLFSFWGEGLLLCVVFNATSPSLGYSQSEETPELLDAADESLTVFGHRVQEDILIGRATSQVSTSRVRERVSKSTPEALGDEVGAYVQQTAHVSA